MVHTLVVPLDGSASAEHALPLALSLVKGEGSRIILLSAVARMPFHAPAGYGEDPPRGWHEEEFGRTSRYLEEVARRLEASVAGLSVDTEIGAGNPVEVLDTRIRALEADLVVMTTHGRGPLRRAWLGSVADGLLRRGPAPILVRRPGEGRAELDVLPRFRKILVPLDGSDLSEAAIPEAIRLARHYGARVSLVTVVPPPFAATSPYVPHVVEDEGTRKAIFQGFQRYLEAQGEPVGKSGFLGDTAVVEGRDVATGILDHRKRIGADLVVMSTRGRGGVARMLLGSVTDKVIRAVDVPVYLHPQPASARD